ncbi:MAG: LPS export ABC transporter ATP-binding protein [Myxococcales bacterium]|nr:LPS export ABC transporter ATP-binding protein [Myxococcales bacterium]
MRLTVRDVSKRYRRREAVRGLSMSLESGTIVGLLGPNGAGKTTTFKMIMGAIRPTKGRIVLGETDVTELPMYRRARLGLGYLAQEPSVFRRLSVRQNLLIALEAIGCRRAERATRVAELTEQFALGALLEQAGETLSGGERRRVEIARLLATGPKLLLFDEPFSGIDPLTIDELKRIIIELKERGIGILITDHRVAETLRICDRAYIVTDGTLLREGTPRAIADDPTVRELYLGASFSL